MTRSAIAKLEEENIVMVNLKKTEFEKLRGLLAHHGFDGLPSAEPGDWENPYHTLARKLYGLAPEKPEKGKG